LQQKKSATRYPHSITLREKSRAVLKITRQLGT